MTHITCRLTTKNRYQLRNPTLGNRVWATFTFFTRRLDTAYVEQRLCNGPSVSNLSTYAAAGAQLHSVRSKCGQCHVYSRRRRLNKDLFSASDLGLGRYDVVDNECVSSHECFDAHGPDIHSRTTIVSHRRLTLKCHKAELCRNDSTDRTRFLSQRLSSSYAALSISVRLCVPHDGRDAGVARSCGSRNLYMVVSGSSQWRNYNFWGPR